MIRILRGWCPLAAILLLLTSRVVAEQTITIGASDPQIIRTTVSTSSIFPTWKEVKSSPTICDTPQQTTERIGDYATFIFEGTSISVFGTVGVKRGIIGISLDGVHTTIDRTAPQKLCDAALFQKFNLPFQQHKIILTLEQHQISQDNATFGQEVGILSLQRIRYTRPGRSSKRIAIIVGPAVGGASIIAAIGVLWFCIRRHRQKIKSRSDHTVFAPDNVIQGSRPIPGQMVTGISSDLVTWPFTLNGPALQQQPAVAHYGVESNPPNRNSQQPLLYAIDARSSAYAVGGARRESQSHTSNSGDRKTRASGPSDHYITNPDRMSTYSYAGTSGGTSGIGDDALAERIADRLASIIETRAGAPVNIGNMIPPPMYEGRPEDEMADFNRRIEMRIEDIPQERGDDPSNVAIATNLESSGPGGHQLPGTTVSDQAVSGSRFSSPPSSAPAAQTTFHNPSMSIPADHFESHPQNAYQYGQRHRSLPPPPLTSLPAVNTRYSVGPAPNYSLPLPQAGNNGYEEKFGGSR